MREEGVDAGRIALLAAASAAAAALGWFALSAMTTPPDFAARKAAVQASLDRAEALGRRTRVASSHGAGAVCPTLTETDLAAVRQEIIGSAGQAGVTLTDLNLAPPASLQGHGRIAPVALRLQGEAAYESVSAWLDLLARRQPEIFVDTLDLANRPPRVSVKLTGKVFCWTRGSQS